MNRHKVLKFAMLQSGFKIRMAWERVMDYQGAQSQKEGQCSLEIHQAIPKLSSYPYLRL